MQETINELTILIRRIINEKSFPTLAKIDKIHNDYHADCIVLDAHGIETQTIYVNLAIPCFVGSQGSITLEPKIGTLVVIDFLYGDKNKPIIVNVIGEGKPQNNALTIKSKQTILSLGEKIILKNQSQNLKDLLEEIIQQILKIQILHPMDGMLSISPDQIIAWESIKQKINMLLE